VIGNHVTHIGEYAFAFCNNLTSIGIPTSVTHIGTKAFRDCDSLPEITIPASVISIGNAPFGFCTTLAAIAVNATNPAYCSTNGVLFNKSRTLLIQYPGGKAGSYAVPDSVTSIGDGAFYCCFRMTGVTIPDSVTSLGNQAFSFCEKLAGVTIPPKVTTIGDEAFYTCYSLSRVAIPASVVNIGRGAFQYCTNLASATICNGVTHIGDRAFRYCYHLASVYFFGDAPDLGGSEVFIGSVATIYRRMGTTDWPPVPDPWAGRPTALWNLYGNPGVQADKFGFDINWDPGMEVVVEACTNLIQTNWVAVATNTLANGTSYFGDPEWASQRCRFYRLRAK
jgi:hypothetical protein